MKPKKKDKSKTKDRNSNLLSFKGIPFEDVLSDLLKIKPEPKQKKKNKKTSF